MGHEATVILLIMTPEHYTSCAPLEFRIALARFVRAANRTAEWYDELSQPRNKRTPMEIILAWNLRELLSFEGFFRLSGCSPCTNLHPAV
jgi:hypothetical protein